MKVWAITLLAFSPLLAEAVTPTGEQIRVAPLLTTRWDQGSCFNRLCPPRSDGVADNDGRRPTGCVSTAMAQIMAYHRWPARPVACQTAYTGPNTLNPEPYDWNAMRPMYLLAADEPSVLAIARLMVDCGISVSTDWQNSYTATIKGTAPYALREAFGYDCEEINAIQYPARARTRMIEDLTAGRPVYADGDGAPNANVESHAFVIDGYAVVDGVDYFHMNYGWAESAPDDTTQNWFPFNAVYKAAGPTFVTVGIQPKSTLQVTSPAAAETGKPYTLQWATPRPIPVTVTQEQWTEHGEIPGETLTAKDWDNFSGAAEDGTYAQGADLVIGARAGNGIPVSTPEPTLAVELKAGDTLTFSYTVDAAFAERKQAFQLKLCDPNDWSTFNAPLHVFDLSEGRHTAEVTFTKARSALGFFIDFDFSSFVPFAPGQRLFTLHGVTRPSSIGAGFVPVQTFPVFAATDTTLAVTHPAAGRYRYVLTPEASPSFRHAVAVVDALPIIGPQRTNGALLSADVTCAAPWSASIAAQQWAASASGLPTNPVRLTTDNNGLTLDFGGATRGGTQWAAVDITSGEATVRKLFYADPPDTFGENDFAASPEEAARKAKASGRPYFLTVDINPQNTVFPRILLAKLTDGVHAAAFHRVFVYCERPAHGKSSSDCHVTVHAADGASLAQTTTSVGASDVLLANFLAPYLSFRRGYLFRLR